VVKCMYVSARLGYAWVDNFGYFVVMDKQAILE
jgi:hypothetical protein